MQRLAVSVVVVLSALIWPAAVFGQYTFGDWASEHGYSSGDAIPRSVLANSSIPPIESLAGIAEFDWRTTPTRLLWLDDNAISSIESGTFSGLRMLTDLTLSCSDSGGWG